MKQTYNKSFFFRGWKNTAAMVAMLAAASAGTSMAQEGSQGNTTVFAGAQATFFGNHTFVAPSAAPGSMAGIINTERTTSAIGTGYGVVNYATASLVVSGADDANHVDGYVRNLGAGLFVYPVGDNGFYGPFAATGAGTTGAYFHTDASTAITSNRAGGDYPALPTGGLPGFPTAQVGAGVGLVSKIEYWDIDGATATPITLTWDAGSNITVLTGGDQAKLTIVGWNPGTSKWEVIASAVDATSVLGLPSDITMTGSITTTAPIVPNTYTAYTFAGIGTPDLTPFITIAPNIMAGPTTFDARVRILNLNATSTSPTTGSVITVRILKNVARWNFTWNAAAASNGLGALNNSVWTYSSNFLYHIWTTTEVIAKGSSRYFGFTGSFTPGQSTGLLPITVTIDYPSGGETNNLNQTDVEVATFNP